MLLKIQVSWVVVLQADTASKQGRLESSILLRVRQI